MSHPIDSEPEWARQFSMLFETAAGLYRSGRRLPEELFSPNAVEFLRSIGASPQELYDYVEDWCELGEPSPDTALAIAAVRNEYFIREQQRRPSVRTMPVDSFPPGSASLGGFRWLPRIIAKARAKLRGELPPELMFSCGGDRAFLKRIGMTPEEFLRLVWEAGEQDVKILAGVEQPRAATVR